MQKIKHLQDTQNQLQMQLAQSGTAPASGESPDLYADGSGMVSGPDSVPHIPVIAPVGETEANHDGEI